MSKLKAKKRAESRKKKSISDEKKRLLKIEEQKRQFLAQSIELQLRNKDVLVNKEKVESRVAITQSKEAQYSKNRINKVVEALTENIGNNDQLALDFVLEELEAASMGNAHSKMFAKQSGVLEADYNGALSRSISAVENGPQAILIQFATPIMTDKGIDYAVKLRTEVVDRVMQIYSLGKYEKEAAALVNAEEVFNEYFDYCKNPKQFGVVEITKKVQMLSGLIAKPSQSLFDHLHLMKIISLCDLKVKSVLLPNKLISQGIFSDLGILSLIDKDTWLNSIKAFMKSGIDQNELIRVLDIPRQVGDLHGRCVINVAPAIYNTFNMIIEELPEGILSNEFIDSLGELSPVSGKVSGGLNASAAYQDWVFEQVGV